MIKEIFKKRDPRAFEEEMKPIPIFTSVEEMKKRNVPINIETPECEK